MRCYLLLALACVVTGSAVGCGGSDAPAPTAANAVVAGAPADTIAQVVYEFLDAVRQGNTAIASQRLTPLALKRTSELDLNFSPPGSPTARFEVGKVETVEADKAVVESTWTDLDADGKPNNESIIWALRFSEGQWRISGMAAELGPDQPPVVIDFENPEAMVQGPPQTPPTGSPGGNSAAAAPAEIARDPFQKPAPR